MPASTPYMKRTNGSIGLVDRLAALGEPLRLRLCRLLERHELSVGEVARVVQLPQSTVSRHLKVLTEAGWLGRRSMGTAQFYRLVMDDLSEPAREIWVAVREDMERTGQTREDDSRARAVLGERRTDSLSFFGRVAGEWDKLRGELFGRAFTAEALLALLPPDWTVADIGCGTGNVAELLAGHVGEVVCVDRSGPMLDAAKKRLGEVENVRFVEGAFGGLGVEAESVDAVTSVLVLHHVEDATGAISEMAGLLKPEGSLLVVDMVRHGRGEYRSTMGHVHLGFDEGEMAGMLEAAGLGRVSVRAVPPSVEGRGPDLFAAVGRRV